MAQHIRIPTPDVPKCDFCSSTEVRWDCPCRDFSQKVAVADATAQLNSSEGWAACDTCKDFIVRGDRDGLAHYSVRRYAEVYPGLQPLTLRVARRIQDAFWANREGPPRPIDGGQHGN